MIQKQTSMSSQRTLPTNRCGLNEAHQLQHNHEAARHNGIRLIDFVYSHIDTSIHPSMIKCIPLQHNQ